MASFSSVADSSITPRRSPVLVSGVIRLYGPPGTRQPPRSGPRNCLFGQGAKLPGGEAARAAPTPPLPRALQQATVQEPAQHAARIPRLPANQAPATATCSQRHVRVWPLFVGVSLAGGGVSVGHNRTRPPPCMRWRGPCSTYRSRLAGLPGSTGSGGPTAGASHPLLVPVSRLLPRPRSFPQGGARFRRESISTPPSSCGASVRGEQLRFFSLSTE